MRVRKSSAILLAISFIFCLSFHSGNAPKESVARYYDVQLDKLLARLHRLETAIRSGNDPQALKTGFLDCRTSYKRVEFLIDVFDQYKARSLNGPDLLRIEEENPDDSIKQHGFQVIESVLYNAPIDKKKLAAEVKILIQSINSFRTDPDRIYYFKDDKIWQGARLGIYRLVSLGITGFDVPLSDHALPETRAVLMSVHQVAGFYKTKANATLFKRGDTLFMKADSFLRTHTNFNTFDRLTFTRDHINRVSDWLTLCAKKSGCINYNERSPLNADASNLFANNIIDLAYFSPNEKYRITPGRIALGKRLFYDSRLSGDGSRNCASCHKPEKAFTDGLPKPYDMLGNKLLLRNTPTLWNTALQTRQFYDSRTETLENQLSAVVHNVDEMGGSLQNSVPVLLADNTYKAAFLETYPRDAEFISQYNIANAISSYVRSLISLNSRFDRYMRRETDSFTAAEKNGFNLFMGKAKCGTCHYAPVFNGLTPPIYQETESEILAVPATSERKSSLDEDPGRFKFTNVPLHRHAFKTPTVRNIALTAPYMHNGVFSTLEEVIDFYNDGGGAGRGISLPTQTLPAEKLNLTKKEKSDIVSFLRTLTDTSGVSYGYLR